MDDAIWNGVLDLYAKLAFFLSAAVARRMLAQGSKGRIVNVSGKAGLSAFAPGAAYSAAKAAVLRLTDGMSAELLKHGITVNAIFPNTIDTPQKRESHPAADFS